ncbi:pyridoxal phosphate-dependent aminotransferase [Micromonospora sp. DR5-3]|uniref:pyridoxal phosphate-dependent aminotransferase n=1 Tax=unclassified Micromonospora TaxID=2617518 RepID=UPI001651D0D3|nr:MULTISPECIES: pyridoxal phosphate-dependent aminotransferase [unclassified Micromonospora]MCW3818311.1 pyridoxal phosphate-dependent aminotransferase [Micromonospora sp. DR5-3]
MQQSSIRAMTARCQELDAINLAQGLCQVPPPASLLAEGARDFGQVDHSYSPAEGLAVFREAVADRLKRHNGLSVEPATGVVATIGATGALMATLTALLDEGDGVLIFEPFYSYHLSALKVLNLRPEPVRLVAPTFEITEEALRAAITDQTRAMIVCTPNNPSGRRFTEAELMIVSAVAEEHDLLVITDEVYEDIYFGPAPHVAPATVGNLGERTLTISSLSKSFSIPGWRLGYVCGPEQLMSTVRVAADALVGCAPTPLQEFGARALRMSDEYYRDLRAMYDGKRRALAEGFAAAGLSPNEPEGSYYLLVDCSPMGVASGAEAAEVLLKRTLIGTVPGEAFYLNPPERPYVRVCFSLPDEVIAEVVKRLASGGL